MKMPVNTGYQDLLRELFDQLTPEHQLKAMCYLHIRMEELLLDQREEQKK